MLTVLKDVRLMLNQTEQKRER